MGFPVAAKQLPEQWQRAFERDRTAALPADPRPERRAARLLAAWIATGLVFLALPGTLVGVLNLIAISGMRQMNAASTAWIQAHGQAQLLGWVVTFIFGISLHVLPKIRGRILDRIGLAWFCWALWTVGIGWRWWGGFSGEQWRAALVGSALLEAAAFALFNYLIFCPNKSRTATPARKPRDLGSWLGIAGFVALFTALGLNLAIAIDLARHAVAPVYPAGPNRSFLMLVLWGFTIPMAWGYGTRFVTIFLGLREPWHRLSLWLASGVAAYCAFALAGWYLAADSLAVALTVVAIVALRVLEPSERPPKRFAVYSGYPAFVRLSFLWLLAGALLGVAADLLTRHTGLGGASRHAITVGFLATLIFAIGPRILPSFMNSRELFSTRLMGAALWLLTAGCTLRVASEAVAYSSGGAAWRLLPLSAFIELAAVVVFTVNMALTMSRRMPAWFLPRTVSGEQTLYWFVASYPATRPLLINAGLDTLAEAGAIPRSLTLAEAAAADRADLDKLLTVLRYFVTTRQPRRSSTKRAA